MRNLLTQGVFVREHGTDHRDAGPHAADYQADLGVGAANREAARSNDPTCVVPRRTQ